MPEYLAWILSFLPLEALAVVVLLFPLVSWLMRSGCVRRCGDTQEFLFSSSFGLVTYVCGNIGAGKTTCAAGMANMLSIIKADQAERKVSEIRCLLSGVDFNRVDSVLMEAFAAGQMNTNAVLSFLLDRDPGLASQVEGKYMDTKLYPSSLVSLLRDYIDAYMALARHDYVYCSNRGFYCWATSSWAMPYDPGMIDVKDRHLDRDYSLLRYSTVFEDEKVLSGKVSTNFQGVAKEDGGGDTFFRLIRHFGKGTIHYISTSQDFGRVVKSERELATGIFYIRKRREQGVFGWRTVVGSVLSDLVRRYSVLYDGFSDLVAFHACERFGRLLACFPDAPDDVRGRWEERLARASSVPSLRSSRLRRVLAFLDGLVRCDFADGFVSYRGIYYTCASDVGKTEESAVGQMFDLDLVFPLSWCYGSVDTYSYSLIEDYLVNEADGSPCTGIDFSDDRIPVMTDAQFRRFVDGVLMKNRDKVGRRRNPEGGSPWGG